MYGLGKTLLPALMLAGVSVGASAQQKACEIDEGSPNQVARAYLDIQTASSAKPEEQPARLKDAVKLLQDGDLKKNPAGRAMVLGKTFVMWMQQPNMATGKTTRGDVGFVTDPTAPFDLIVGIDSAFSVVEASNPECLAQTNSYRQQKAWVDLVNQSNDLANGNQIDSAVVLAKRSLILYKHAPYGYNVLAQAAMRNNKPKDAIDNFKLAIAAAQDSTMADTRRQLLAYVGNYAADQVESSTGADKAYFLGEAKAAYEQLAKDPGTKFADNARTGQARLAMLSGDTTAIKGSYADQLANPGAFSYNSLMLAAVTAAKAQQSHDAIKLFEAARAVNPYHRDVLYNLGRLYLLDSNFTKGIETANQLVKVDPDNPDNYQLLAVGYGSIKKGYDAQQKDWEAKAKMYGDRANKSKSAPVVKAAVDSAARVSPFIKAYADSSKSAIDSALKYQTVMATVPARVTFTEFTTASDGKTTIGGSISNQTDAAKSYTIKFEFIDKSGNAVASQDVAVGPVGPHERTSFKATGAGAGIVAFRYAPLP
jgi:tetratricopeptide (TPR) repeat protein